MTNFLRQPATKRDVLVGSAVIALLIVFLIYLAVRVAIDLQERYDLVVEQNRIVVQKSDQQEQMITSQGEQLDAAEAQLASQSEPTIVYPTRRRTVQETRTIPQPRTVAAVGASRPSLPSLEPRERPVRPSLPRPTLPDRPARSRPPERPQSPSEPAPAPPAPAPPVSAPSPPIAALPPRPQPPVARPPILTPPAPQPPVVTEPPRPGNKPPHAPCPPKNPNCG